MRLNAMSIEAISYWLATTMAAALAHDPHALHATDFDMAWVVLGRLGQCDAIGGAEYWRVLREWADGPFVVEPTEFIRRWANCPPPVNGVDLAGPGRVDIDP
jgi:hypothetical protein